MTTPKQSLFIQIEDDGVREIFEPDAELMAELGWVRVEQNGAAPEAPTKSLGEILSAEIPLPYATNGHPTPDLSKPSRPVDVADVEWLTNQAGRTSIPDLTPLPREPAESGIPRDGKLVSESIAELYEVRLAEAVKAHDRGSRWQLEASLRDAILLRVLIEVLDERLGRK